MSSDNYTVFKNVFYQQLLYNETLIQRNTITVKFQGASLRNTKISTERDKILI